MAATSAQRKLAWGIKRIDGLARETLTYEHAHAYVARVEREVRSPQEIQYSVYAVEREAPSDDWPLMAGEIVQSLRAALDHAVYAAGKGKGKTQFPIFTDEREFRVKGRPWISPAPEAVRTRIEEAQPYRHLPEFPKADPLAILSRLSNLDKHRTLATVAAAADLSWIGSDEGAEIRWDDVRIGQPLYDGAKIKSFTVISKSEIEEMEVDPQFTYEVRLEREGSLLQTLIYLAKRVFEVVTECETGLPISPFARYPIMQPLPGRHLDGSLIRG